MASRVGFRLSRIVIIESLKSNEVKTGLLTADFIRSLDSVATAGIPIEYYDCDGIGDFNELLKNLTAEATRTLNSPLLHVECHGHNFSGLHFRDESSVSWSELSDLLVTLNKATRFNLISVFSACYGAYFLSRLSAVDPCPCYAMLAPTEEIWSPEILGAFRAFYSELFNSMDAGRAMSTISTLALQEGAWMPLLAETWYEDVVTNYVQKQCTKHEMKVRSLRTFKALQASGVPSDIHSIKQGLIQGNRESLTGKLFERYFMVDDIPENATRFQTAKSRLNKRIEELRATGRYGI